MGKIFFGQYVNLMSFNFSQNTVDNIRPPIVNLNTKDSILYTQASHQYYDNDNHTLSAVYKTNSLSSEQYAIYRASPDDSKMTYLGVLNNVTNGVIDYGVASNKRYKYIVQTNPKSNSNIVMQTDFLNIHWNKWSIVSLSYDLQNDVYIPDSTVFLFDNNINVGSISDNLNIVKYNTLGRFGKVIQGNQQYDSGSFSCLFGDFQSVYNLNRAKNLIIDKASKNDIINSIIIRIENAVQEAVGSTNLHQDIESFDFYTVYTNVCQNNLTINIYSNGNIELLWIDNINNCMYQGISNDNIYGSINDLLSHMPESYQRKIYCDITFTQEKHLKSYLFLQNYKEYYSHATQWYPVEKHFAYYDNDEKMTLWKSFVSDHKLKLLKSPKGDMWVVVVSDQTSRDVNYNTISYPTTISFNWQEIVDKDKISIMSW